MIEKCLERQIEYINVISVYNPLTITLDPLFFGLTNYQGFQMAAKTIKKINPSESIGVFLNLKGKPTMMDYMDIPKHLTELTDNDQNLVYRGGNILNYLIGVQKLNEILLDDEKYKDLISEFHKETGMPILFNTSFNLGGEPLVETLDDAVRTLANSLMEYLYLPEYGYLVEVKNDA